MPDPSTQRSLEEGDRRSREVTLAPAPSEPTHVVLWRRYRWWAIGALLFFLTEMALFALGGAVGMHF